LKEESEKESEIKKWKTLKLFLKKITKEAHKI
jgi:hypothetical protein